MEMRSKLGLDLKYNYVCFVGNLLPWQGVEYLIHAAPLILEKHSNVRFLIIGDGVMKKELEQLSSDFEISDSFIFTGYTKYEDIPSYISASDICVAPYIKNRTTSPLKIYEYFACGRPVVASNVSDVNDLFIKSEGGICITPEDINELSRAILNLLQNNELRKKMGENGYKYVLENQTWDNVAKKTETIFKDLVFESNK
jgi:glycosyltransferase involved in cell wall biosynthesis